MSIEGKKKETIDLIQVAIKIIWVILMVKSLDIVC